MPELTSTASLLEKGILWSAESSFESSSFYPIPFPSKQSTEAQFGIYEIDSILPRGGIAAGAIHEWMFDDALDSPPLIIPAYLAANLLRQNEDARSVFWIGKDVWPSPYLLAQRDPLLLSRSVFLDPPSEKIRLWCLETALRSSASRAVVASVSNFTLAQTKRLSLAAAYSGATGFIIRKKEELSLPSSALTRWIVKPTPSETATPSFLLHLARCKGASPIQREWKVQISDETISLSSYSDRGSEEASHDRCVGF